MTWMPERGAIEAISECLCERPGADDEHVVRVAATAALRLEPAPEHDPAGEHDRRLNDEEDRQEEAANVVLVQQEQSERVSARTTTVPRTMSRASAIQPHRARSR